MNYSATVDGTHQVNYADSIICMRVGELSKPWSESRAASITDLENIPVTPLPTHHEELLTTGR